MLLLAINNFKKQDKLWDFFQIIQYNMILAL